MKNYGNNFEEFFEENPIFDDETKKAMFLEGVLAQKLLNIQYSERNATPFRSRLNGLKIDEKIAKRLLPEIINKLEEYEKNYYRKLEETIGEYLVKSNFSHYSVDELSYYFALGMVLSKYFGTEKENKNE
jgi:CRISPR-associated protein Csh1